MWTCAGEALAAHVNRYGLPVSAPGRSVTRHPAVDYQTQYRLLASTCAGTNDQSESLLDKSRDRGKGCPSVVAEIAHATEGGTASSV